MAKKILIIDDHPKIVSRLADFLSNQGYEVCSASDGVEGFEAVHKEKPNLIILDLQLADEWGSRFFRMFTEVEEFKKIPLIVKSGRAGTFVATDKAVASFDKPYDPFDILRVVRENIGDGDAE